MKGLRPLFALHPRFVYKPLVFVVDDCRSLLKGLAAATPRPAPLPPFVLVSRSFGALLDVDLDVVFCVVLCWLPSRRVQTAIGLIYLIPMWTTGMQKVPKLTKDDIIKVRAAFVACSTTNTRNLGAKITYRARSRRNNHYQHISDLFLVSNEC